MVSSFATCQHATSAILSAIACSTANVLGKSTIGLIVHRLDQIPTEARCAEEEPASM